MNKGKDKYLEVSLIVCENVIRALKYEKALEKTPNKQHKTNLIKLATLDETGKLQRY